MKGVVFMKGIKCELCGSNSFTKVDGIFKCDYCNTEYTEDEAKKITVSGTVEFVQGSAEKDRLLKNAETFILLKQFKKAKEIFEEVSNHYPDDWRGWFGLFKLPFEEYWQTGSFSYPLQDNYNNMIQLSPVSKF